MSTIKDVMSPLTAERLREVLHYDPITGVFRWKISDKLSFIGSIAGTLDIDGYRKITIDRWTYKAHRLAWLYVRDSWPRGEVDHEDTVRDHNWFSNLRDVTTQQNRWNSRTPSTNTSGLKGVSYVKSRRKWRAAIKRDRITYFLGHFASAEEAHAVYAAKAKELHGPFANSGLPRQYAT
jgi:HNH endonuclease